MLKIDIKHGETIENKGFFLFILDIAALGYYTAQANTKKIRPKQKIFVVLVAQPTPTVKLFIENSHVLLFPICLNKSPGCFILHIYTIVRLKLSQDADNAQLLTVYRFIPT